MKKQKKSTQSRSAGQFVKKQASGKTHAKSTVSYSVRDGRLRTTAFKEPASGYSVSSKLRDIGNSKGVILNNRILEDAGITSEADLIIHASDGMIIIQARYTGSVNTNLATWDAEFKKSFKKDKLPEGDMWKGLENKFDQEEWT